MHAIKSSSSYVQLNGAVTAKDQNYTLNWNTHIHTYGNLPKILLFLLGKKIQIFFFKNRGLLFYFYIFSSHLQNELFEIFFVATV